LKRHTRKRKWAMGTQKAGWCAPDSLHTIIGDGYNAGGHLYQTSQRIVQVYMYV